MPDGGKIGHIRLSDPFGNFVFLITKMPHLAIINGQSLWKDGTGFAVERPAAPTNFNE
jgi:hypothetical protein